MIYKINYYTYRSIISDFDNYHKVQWYCFLKYPRVLSNKNSYIEYSDTGKLEINVVSY